MRTWIDEFKLWQQSKKNGRLPNDKEIEQLIAKVTELEKENKILSAKLWVAKDSALRTYDGLTDKASKYEALEAKLKVAINALKICAENGSRLVARETLVKLEGE